MNDRTLTIWILFFIAIIGLSCDNRANDDSKSVKWVRCWDGWVIVYEGKARDVGNIVYDIDPRIKWMDAETGDIISCAGTIRFSDFPFSDNSLSSQFFIKK